MKPKEFVEGIKWYYWDDKFKPILEALKWKFLG